MKAIYGREKVSVKFLGVVVNRLDYRRKSHHLFTNALYMPADLAEEMLLKLLQQKLPMSEKEIEQGVYYGYLVVAAKSRGFVTTNFKTFGPWLGDLKPLYLISELESPSRDYKPYSDLRQKYYVRGQQPKNPSGRYKIGYIWTEGTKTYELYNRIERLTEEFMERCQ